MLMSYPDYGKSTEHYQAGIIGVFAEYPEDIQKRLAHPIHGIRGRCAFLPTIADVVRMAEEIQEAQARDRDFDRRYGHRRVVAEMPIAPFNPYPKLTAAFSDEPELLRDRDFDDLTAASKALAVHGKAESKRLLDTMPKRIVTDYFRRKSA